MGKLIPFLFIALDGKSAVAHLRLRIPGHKLRGSWFKLLPEGGTTQRGCTIVLRRSGQKKCRYLMSKISWKG